MLATLLLTTTLYLGEIKREWIDIQLRIDEGNVVGATYRPHTKVLRLVTGTATKGHVVLREWSSPGVETAKIDGRISKRGLRGTWGGRRFDFWPGGISDSPLSNDYQLTWPAFQRLHDAYLAHRNGEAMFNAQLVCAMNDEGCRWMRALAAGTVPPPHPCDWAHRISCLFQVDALPKMPEWQRKIEAKSLCEDHLLACEEHFGANAVALAEAAGRGDAEAVAKILATKPDVNASGGAFRSPLQRAIWKKSLPVVKLLVEHGADPNAVELENAVYEPDSIVLYLLDHGAKPAHGVLWNAVYLRKHKVALKALERGADVDEEFPAGTPLTGAVDNRDLAMVRVLLAHCADPDSETNHSDGSPIDHARKRGEKKILALLRAARRNANCPHPAW